MFSFKFPFFAGFLAEPPEVYNIISACGRCFSCTAEIFIKLVILRNEESSKS